MKILLIAVFAVSLAALVASPDDGASTGTVYSPNDPKAPIGTYFVLKKNGKPVYHRYHSQRGKDFRYREQFFVDGTVVLEVRHLNDSVGFLFTSYKDYQVATSVTGSAGDKVTISSVKDGLEYSWKRDAEGYLAKYAKKSPSALPTF